MGGVGSDGLWLGRDSGRVASDRHLAHDDSQGLSELRGGDSPGDRCRAAFVAPAVVANVERMPIRD